MEEPAKPALVEIVKKQPPAIPIPPKPQPKKNFWTTTGFCMKVLIAATIILSIITLILLIKLF